jgi:hypothetical protein
MLPVASQLAVSRQSGLLNMPIPITMGFKNKITLYIYNACYLIVNILA